MQSGKPAEVTAPALRISLFGQPRLEHDGRPLRFSAPPKTIPLLAYLIVNPGAQTRDSIAFTLWQDNTEEEARANLRRHLYHLQRALPQPGNQPWLLVDSESLQWNAGAGAWVDVVEFTRLVNSSDSLEAAVELYAGDLLQNYYEDWVIAARERLRNEYLNALYALIVDHRSCRSWDNATRYARALLQADPLREDALCQLMSAQYESGDRAGAIQTFADFRRRLRAEMAIDPMPETSALHENIVHNAPLPVALGTTPVSLGTPHVALERSSRETRGQALPSLPFVGRQAEMEQLRSLWNRAARGSTSVAFIEGEAGIGKSRLAAELALRVEAEGGRVLWGPTSFPESSPYQGLAEAFRQALPLVSALKINPAALAAVATLVPELRERRADLPHLPAADPDDERRRLLEGIAATLEALGESRPLLLIVEDVHWAGDATISALRHLGSTSRRAPLLIVATNREEEVPRSHALRALQRDLSNQGSAFRVSPWRLQSDDVRNLVSQIAQLSRQTSATNELAAQLHARSEGNCLFLAQMIGDILEMPGRALETEPAASGTVTQATPGGLRQVIESRLSRLSEEARSLAEVSAVIGRGFNAELVAEVSGWSKDKVFDGFNELLDRRLIWELPKRGSFEYSFSHQLIRDAVYNQIPRAALVARHRRAGHVLAESPEATRGEVAAEIARHLDIGEERERAGQWYFNAARHALSLFADVEASAHLTRAIALSADARLQTDALLLIESIHARQGSRDEQQCDLDKLEQLASKLADANLRVEILSRRVERERALGNREAEARLIEQFAEAAQASGNMKWIARAQLATAYHAYHIGQVDNARADAHRALRTLQQAHDRESEVECLCLLADIHTQRGALDEAESILRQAQHAAEAGSHPALIARAYLAISRAAITQHQFVRCAEACASAAELFRSVGYREGEADALAHRASVLGRLQRYEEARKTNEASAAIYEAIGKDEGRATQLINGATLDTRLGLLDSGVQKLLAANQIFERLGELRGRTVCALNLSFLYMVRDELDEAEIFARSALEHARTLQHKAFTAQALANLGAVERDLGQYDAALDHMQQALELQDTVSRPADQVNDLADMALTYLMKGDMKSARQIADRMLAAAEESTDAAFWPQAIFWTAARVYEASGEPKRASELTERARTYAQKIGNLLADPATREQYDKLPVNQQIFAATTKSS
jgi:predicted ATPase/DNA-binding SARP family transcriptional activator